MQHTPHTRSSASGWETVFKPSFFEFLAEKAIKQTIHKPREGINGLSSVIQNLWLHPHKPEIQKWSVLWSIVTRWFWQYLLCLMWEPFFLFLHAARQLQQLWWRGQHQMRWCCCAVAGVSLTVSTAPQSRASYRHTRWSHDASVNGAIRYSFTSYSPRIHTFPLGINVCTQCIHSTWIWSTSRMWTNSAKCNEIGE